MKNDNNIEMQEFQMYKSEDIWITDFTEQSAIKFHDDIMQRFEQNPYKPIIINISSYGGNVDALLSMLDSMDAVRSMGGEEFRFLTVASGKACSAGAVLLSYGDYRFSTPSSRIMLHQVVSGTFGSHPENEAEFAETTRVNTKLLQLIKKRCKLKMSVKELKNQLSHNVYLTPQQALSYGLIDIIGYPKLLEQTFYEVRVLNAEMPKKAKK